MSSTDVDILVDELSPARRSLRVATVTETYPPEINGVANTVARMAEGLRARGHAVQLVRLRQSVADGAASADLFDEVLLPGMPVPRYPHLKMGVPCRRALIALWMRQRPDVVHIATEGPLGWSALRAARHLQLPVVSDFRTNFHAYSRHYGVGWLRKPIVAYLRKFHNQTLRTMVPTGALRRELGELGFVNLAVVGRGVDTQMFNPVHRDEALRSRWGVGPDTLVMLYVGRVAAEKNLGLLRESYEAACSRGLRVSLVVVGDGPERAALQAAWPDAHFAGVRRGAELAAHYASADLFVFPSLTETFGNVLIEAMASGLAVVAFEHAAAGEIVWHGRDGLLAGAGDREQFVAQVLEAASDATLRHALGSAAHQTASLHGWDHVIRDFESVLTQSIGQTSAVHRLRLRAAIG